MIRFLTLETDKATMEIPATAAGVVKEVLVKAGSKISQGTLILRLEDDAKAAAPQASAESTSSKTDAESKSAEKSDAKTDAKSDPKPEAKPETAVKTVAAASADAESQYIHAGPAVRQFGRELGIDLSKITGTGQKGRITREDLAQFVKSQMSNSGGASLGLMADPVVNFADFGEINIEKPLALKKSAAPH